MIQLHDARTCPECAPYFEIPAAVAPHDERTCPWCNGDLERRLGSPDMLLTDRMIRAQRAYARDVRRQLAILALIGLLAIVGFGYYAFSAPTRAPEPPQARDLSATARPVSQSSGHLAVPPASSPRP